MIFQVRPENTSSSWQELNSKRIALALQLIKPEVLGPPPRDKFFLTLSLALSLFLAVQPHPYVHLENDLNSLFSETADTADD